MKEHPKPIQRYIKSLGEKVYCTNSLQTGTRLLEQDEALKHSLVSLNQILRHYIVLDIDYAGGALAYEEIGLEPTIIISNPGNGHAHLFFELKSPVTFSENARTKPQDFYLAVNRGMIAAMAADPCYAGFIAKNPLSDRWRMTCCDVRYDLSDIIEYCDPIELLGNTSTGEGRNSDLFNKVRFWAYRRVREYASFRAWEKIVLYQCQLSNTSQRPLKYAEVKATAKSIAKWTWKHRYRIGSPKDRGAANVGKSLPLQEKQRLGAAYTNGQRKDDSECKINAAVFQIKIKQEKVTGTAIARLTGLSRKTVYNHSHLWNQ